MTDDFLRLDVGILLCRYGRRRILMAMAEAEDCSVGELESRLTQIRERKAPRKAAGKKSLVERLEQDFRDHPDRAAELRPYVVAYENGIFLPSLKAVQRFLESRDMTGGALRSRKLAGPHVLKALTEMSPTELSNVRHNLMSDRKSDFSILSDAILSRE